MIFLESETLPKSSFSAAINDSMEPNTCGRACISSPRLFTVQLLDVSGESAGLWKGFL